jgi:hypothetical protein
MKATHLADSAEHENSYATIWGVAVILATVFTPLVVIFKESAPWLIVLPIAIGGVFLLILEFERGGFEVLDRLFFWRRFSPLVTSKAFEPLKAYEELIALEIKPKRKVPKEQLPLFKGFEEPEPTHSIRFLTDEHGREVAVISCERFSALLLTYLLQNTDKATERALAAGLKRFAHDQSVKSDIRIFVEDKSVREAIKADFRGNIVVTLSNGGQRIIRDLLKAVAAASAKNSTENPSPENKDLLL